jgi:hypothetical protein
MSTEHLSDKQLARVEALQQASAVGRKSAGPFGGATPPDTQDLVDLAEYILNGTHPLDRYGDADNVHDA